MLHSVPFTKTRDQCVGGHTHTGSADHLLIIAKRYLSEALFFFRKPISGTVQHLCFVGEKKN